MVAMIRPMTSLGATSALKSVTPYMDDAAVLAMRQGVAATKGPQPAIPTGVQSGVKTAFSPIDMTLGVAEKATGYAGMIPFLAMPIGLVGKGFSWVGNKTNVNVIKKVGGGLGKPTEYLARDAGETMLGKPVIAASRVISNASASVVGGVSRTTGLDRFLQRRYTTQAEKQWVKARTLLDGLPEAPAHLRSEVSEMQALVRSTAKPNAGHIAQLETLLEKVEKPVEKAAKAVSKEAAKASEKASKAFSKPLAKATKSLGKAASHVGSAEHWGNVEKGMRAVPDKLSKMDTGHVLMNSAFAAGSAVSMASDLRTFGQKIAALKIMYHDLTGQNISTFGLLVGKVPPVIAAARSKLRKTLVIKEATDAISVGISLRELSNRHFSGSAKAMIGFMAAGMIGSTAESMLGDTSIQVYQAMKTSFDGQPKSQDYYAEYIGEISTDLKKRGGASSKFTQAVAKQYADEHATPEQILREINSGALNKRIDALIAAAPQPEHPADKAKQERTVMGKHTEKVMNKAAVQSQQPGHAVT